MNFKEELELKRKQLTEKTVVITDAEMHLKPIQKAKRISTPKIEKPIEEPKNLEKYTATNDAIRTAYYLLFGKSTRTSSKETLIAIRDQIDRIL